MKVWILTSSYNDYDQHGEYFLAAFKDKPTKQQILDHCDIHSEFKKEGLVDHILSGGGRQNVEYQWFYLEHKELL